MQLAAFHPSRFTLRHHLRAYPPVEAALRFYHSRRAPVTQTLIADPPHGEAAQPGPWSDAEQAWYDRCLARLPAHGLDGAVLTRIPTADGSPSLLLRSYAPHAALHNSFTVLGGGEEVEGTTVYTLNAAGDLVIAINGGQIITKHLQRVAGRRVVHAGEDFRSTAETLSAAGQHTPEALNLSPADWDQLSEAHARAATEWLVLAGILEMLPGQTPGGQTA